MKPLETLTLPITHLEGEAYKAEEAVEEEEQEEEEGTIKISHNN